MGVLVTLMLCGNGLSSLYLVYRGVRLPRPRTETKRPRSCDRGPLAKEGERRKELPILYGVMADLPIAQRS